jgi:hypothetical protein
MSICSLPEKCKAPATATIEIVAHPVDRHGRFDVDLGDTKLCHSTKTPFFDAARRLIELGEDPDAVLILWRDGVPSLRGRLRDAAGLTVKEPDRGRPHFAEWRPFASSPVAPPIASRPRAATPGHDRAAEQSA